MKPVFAFQATTMAPNAVAGSFHSELGRRSLAWVSEIIGLGDSAPSLRPDRSASLRDDGTGARIDIEARRSDTTTVLSLRFGSGGAPAGFHEGELTVYSEGLFSTITLRLLASDSTALAGVLDHKPALIDDLAKAVPLAIGGIPVNEVAVPVDVKNVANTAAQLLSSKRTYPVVAISTRSDGSTAVKPASLAADLAGLALTIHIRNSPASDRIATDLGAALGVKDGAIRVYWPELTPDASPYLHRSYATGDKSATEDERTLREAIYANVVRVLAQRIEPDKRVANALLTMPEIAGDEQDPSDAIDTTSVEVADPGPANACDPPDARFDEVRGEYESRIAELELQIEASAARIEELERDRFNLSEAHRLASQMDRFSLDSLHQFELITDALAIDSLAALVRLYEQHVPDRAIVFLPEAHESARNSPYSGNLLGPAHLLRAVCEVATRYHFGNLREGEDFKRAFEAAGETSFAADSSPTTLSKYRSKYERTYTDGSKPQEILLRPHVSFGSGRANSSVKIYWHVDDTNRRFVVGQIGEHLPIAKRF